MAKRDYRGEMKLGDPRKIETENRRRSDHSDFATSSELKGRKFSGYRLNTITQELELWVLGVLRATVPAPNGQPDPDKVQEVSNRVFGMGD
jgi:hypothetical protein